MRGVPRATSVLLYAGLRREGFLNVLFGGSDHRFFRFELVLIELLQQSRVTERATCRLSFGIPDVGAVCRTFWREAELAVDVLDDVAKSMSSLTELAS